MTRFSTPSATWRRRSTRAASLALIAAPFAIGAIAVPRLGAQAPQAPPPAPSFEVASIKLNNSGDGRVMMQNQPGRYTATNVNVRMLIRNAYQLQDFQIGGGPSWINSDRYDIVAKVEAAQDDAAGPPMPGQPSRLQLMIRSLLADRFKLVVHDETKEQPIYALVLAKSDGRLGPELKKSDTDCAALAAAGRGRGRGMPPPGPPQPGDRVPCGIRIGPGNMAIGGSTMAQFASSLGMFVGRIVVDKTGLPGAYDFNLTWTPDQMPNRPPGAPEIPVDPNGPSIFTAVQEQLGLKLDSQRGPVAMLIIDRIEKPVEN